MADDLKQQFIEAVRLTPDGIQDFLETPIPTAPTIGTPADVDAAIIANGVAAKYILDLFNAYAGYTPIEGILRIGQHNSVLESAMIAGLEYITETEEQNDIEILAPESGTTLKPGDVLLSAQAKNGTLIQCAVEIEGQAPISLADTDGVFEGTITIEEPGDYTATFTGLFEKEKTATASTTFTIDDEGDEPGGNNKKALQTALKNFDTAFQKMCALISYHVGIDEISTQFALVKKAALRVAGIVGAKNSPGFGALSAQLDEQIETVENNMAEPVSGILDALAALPTTIKKIASLMV